MTVGMQKQLFARLLVLARNAFVLEQLWAEPVDGSLEDLVRDFRAGSALRKDADLRVALYGPHRVLQGADNGGRANFARDARRRLGRGLDLGGLDLGGLLRAWRRVAARVPIAVT